MADDQAHPGLLPVDADAGGERVVPEPGVFLVVDRPPGLLQAGQALVFQNQLLNGVDPITGRVLWFREVPNFRGQGRPSPGTPDPAVPDAVLQQAPGAGVTAVGAGFPGAIRRRR